VPKIQPTMAILTTFTASFWSIRAALASNTDDTWS